MSTPPTPDPKVLGSFGTVWLAAIGKSSGRRELTCLWTRWLTPWHTGSSTALELIAHRLWQKCARGGGGATQQAPGGAPTHQSPRGSARALRAVRRCGGVRCEVGTLLMPRSETPSRPHALRRAIVRVFSSTGAPDAPSLLRWSVLHLPALSRHKCRHPQADRPCPAAAGSAAA